MYKGKKQFSLETLYKITYDLKKCGLRIGITHGAFDLFHHSHLDLLQKASTICDFLIVGVDSDISVSEYKSNKRPVVEEESRMEIINELDCVDATFVKNIDLTPESHVKLYRNLLVDYVMIGQEFSAEELIVKDAHQAGARLIKFDTEQKYSTSSIIQSIIDRYAPED